MGDANTVLCWMSPTICYQLLLCRLSTAADKVERLLHHVVNWSDVVTVQHLFSYGTGRTMQEDVRREPVAGFVVLCRLHSFGSHCRARSPERSTSVDLHRRSVRRHGLVFAVIYPLCERDGVSIFPVVLLLRRTRHGLSSSSRGACALFPLSLSFVPVLLDSEIIELILKIRWSHEQLLPSRLILIYSDAFLSVSLVFT